MARHQESAVRRRSPLGDGSRTGVRLVASVAALAVAGSIAVAQSLDSAAAATQSPELVVNGSFSQGVAGWRTSGATTQRLSIGMVVGDDDPRAQVTSTRTPTTIVLNDVKNTVGSTVAGTSYVVTAAVKPVKVGVNGQLRVREVANGTAVTHATSFNLKTTGWRTVTLAFTAQRSGASLDLNVLGWNVPNGNGLRVDDVSMRVVTSTPAPTTTAPTSSPTATSSPKPTTSPRPTTSPSPTSSPTASPTSSPTPTSSPSPTPTSSPKPTASPTPSPSPTPGRCTAAVPDGPTEFGSSISTSGITPDASLSEVDKAFGKIGAVRVFDPGLPSSWSSLRSRVTSDRTVIVSFRPDPKEVLAGTYDAQLRAFFRDAPDDQVVYWSYIHEPEPLIANGTFTEAQYRAAWKRIAGFEKEFCKPNMYATLILTGYTAEPVSKRSWTTYYPGDDVIDVMAWDPYNGASDPTRDFYASAASIFANPVKASREAGKPFAIAETGSRLVPGDDGRARAAWLTSVGAYLKANDAVFATYFQSTNAGNWRLDDVYSQRAWGAFVTG
ncbi:hypothetical protein KIN34_01185 [Cellulomonas sp. DKR-3]|uniref:GH26 domain-containing protein n=1 Tax=Cellulomonas fulva TaxID=2835530 RepID=A0ABS5TUT4_9CELL|nr:hypothetical protein [Cellulomonas fulva]MBT0992905.1 hypothetical protein [Cellulomonas fulva]